MNCKSSYSNWEPNSWPVACESHRKLNYPRWPRTREKRLFGPKLYRSFLSPSLQFFFLFICFIPFFQIIFNLPLLLISRHSFLLPFHSIVSVTTVCRFFFSFFALSSHKKSPSIFLLH